VELRVVVALASTRSPPCSAADVSSLGATGSSPSPGLELTLVGFDLVLTRKRGVSWRDGSGTQHPPSNTAD
jgi:hypothetical protein